MLIKIVSYIPAIVGVLTVGLFIFLNNPKDIKNRIFALFNLTIAIWLSFLFLADSASQEDYALWFLRFALFFGGLVFLNFFLFSIVFPFSLRISKKKLLFYILPLLLITLLSLTPLVVESVRIESFGAQPNQVGYLYTFSDVIGIAYLISGGIILIRKYKKSNDFQKNQIRIILMGLSIAIVTNVITGQILTAMDVDSSAILFGGFSLFIFSLFVAYAIVKHKLFDVRLIVARSIAYILLVATLSIIYVGGIILPSFYILPDSSESLRNIIPFIAALFVAGSAPFLKRFFDRITNRIFYRDAYDPQLFLDTLNKALVGEIEIEKLLNGVSVIMENNLKSSYVAIGVKETENRPLRILGANAPKYKPDDIMFVRSELVKMGQKTVLASNLSSDRRKLQEVFRQNDIEIIVRLLTGYDTEEEAIAYLILGPKKSGNIYNKQDLAILGIIADELVIAIQNTLRFEEIQAFAVTLQEKVDEATAKLRRTNLKLKEMDETKDEFISMASHQLRTPLTSVKGYLSMVLDGDAGKLKPQQQELLEQSFLSSQRMVYIIADLLNVSRLKTGKFVLDINPTDLINVVQGEIDQLHEAFRSKNLKITFTKPKDFPSLLLDETKIRQVIMNFIDNAVYYTPAGGNIWVELKQDKKHVYFTVKDSGLGVPKSEQSHLFGKFYRATNARKARPDGTGLGLFMAKRVVLAQGGSILFESAEGKGSTFGFCFETEKLLPKTEK